MGYANVRDTAAIDAIIYSETAKRILPANLKLLWSAKPADGLSVKNVYELHAIKVTSSNGRAPLEGDVITDAKDQFNNLTGQPEVSMSMNTDGARRWAALTKANVSKARLRASTARLPADSRPSAATSPSRTPRTWPTPSSRAACPHPHASCRKRWWAPHWAHSPSSRVSSRSSSPSWC